MKKYPISKVLNKILMWILVTSAVSCIPQRKIEYLQNPVDLESKYSLMQFEANKIQTNDQLLIIVSSFDEVMFNFVEDQNRGANSTFSTELSLSSISYSVDDSGYIYYPVIGKFMVKGLTMQEASEQLKIKLSTYFDQPNVIIKLAYNKITILGAVNDPGYHTYSKDRITIFDALGLAGDVTLHGNLKEVYLIRNLDEDIVKTKVDLTSDNILLSEYYYLRPNDFLYVKPRSTAKWRDMSTPVSLFLSSITTAILVLNYISRN